MTSSVRERSRSRIIDASYNCGWHGSLVDLRSNLDDISARYGKPVMVIETVYGSPWPTMTLPANVFNQTHVDRCGYPGLGEVAGAPGTRRRLVEPA